MHRFILVQFYEVVFPFVVFPQSLSCLQVKEVREILILSLSLPDTPWDSRDRGLESSQKLGGRMVSAGIVEVLGFFLLQGLD